MSASLVGSEMCIRDSLPCGSRCRPWNLAARPRPMLQCRPSPPYMGGSGSVSYTHLTLPTICSV
eukprot:6151969-Alexandrium_andersonii.AAC.1